MKKVLSILIFACLMASLTVQTGALEYTIDAPGDPDYGKPTSIEPVITADGGAAVNEDRSKNAALIPPTFGSPILRRIWPPAAWRLPAQSSTAAPRQSSHLEHRLPARLRPPAILHPPAPSVTPR